MATGTHKTTSENFGTMGQKAGEEAKKAGDKVGEEAKKAGDKAGEQAKNIGERVGETAKNIGEKVGETAKHFGEKVGEQSRGLASAAVHKAEDAGTFVGHRAEDATGAVGSGMKQLGSTIRENAPKQGMLAGAGAAVADTLESGGRYLEEHKLQEIGEDVTNMIRRNPIPAVLIGIGIGFLLAKAMRS